MDWPTILKLCQWYESSDGIPSGACPSGLNLSKVKRFSSWVKLNSDSFVKLVNAGSSKVRYSWGNKTASLGNKNWQKMALLENKWPDGSSIYDVNGSGKLYDQRASICTPDIVSPVNICNVVTDKKAPNTDDHFNHVHVDLR